VEGREGKGREVPLLDLNPGDATGGYTWFYKCLLKTVSEIKKLLLFFLN